MAKKYTYVEDLGWIEDGWRVGWYASDFDFHEEEFDTYDAAFNRMVGLRSRGYEAQMYHK